MTVPSFDAMILVHIGYIVALVLLIKKLSTISKDNKLANLAASKQLEALTEASKVADQQLAAARRDTRKYHIRLQAITTRLYNAAGVPAPHTPNEWAQEITNVMSIHPEPMCAVVFDPDDDLDDLDAFFPKE